MAARLEQVIDSTVIGQRIDRWLMEHAVERHRSTLEAVLRGLIDAGLDRLPMPGQGATLQRWQALEQVARRDLALVKWYEGHTDALAILQEIDGVQRPERGAAYAVWASESRSEPVTIRAIDQGISLVGDDEAQRVRIDGRKSWCSGARVVDAALLTATDANGDRRLVEVRMGTPGISIDDSRWQAVGMQRSGSFDVIFHDVAARLVGPDNGYLDRPGFWHGGAGIAACWFGAAAAIGTAVRDLQRGRDDVHALAHLGTIDGALASGAALLRETAAAIDAAPARDAMRLALRARGAMADLAELVVHHATRAVGPGPLCNDARLASLVADLPIFIRQSRAEHDLVAQGRALLVDDAASEAGWRL